MCSSDSVKAWGGGIIYTTVGSGDESILHRCYIEKIKGPSIAWWVGGRGEERISRTCACLGDTQPHPHPAVSACRSLRK